VAAKPGASRAGLAPTQRPAPPPVDARLRPWYDRCKSDHDRLATIAGQHSTSYALRAYTARLDGLRDLVNRQEVAIASLQQLVAELSVRLSQVAWQPPLTHAEQGKLPESVKGSPPTKAGSRPAAAVSGR
jgi:hypothetical protein